MNQPQPAPQTKPAIIRPWLLIVFIITLLAAGGYIGWWYYANHKVTTPTTTPTTQPAGQSPLGGATADWKTYTNDAYGFSFEYPADYLINDTLQSAGKTGGVHDRLELSDNKGENFDLWINQDGFGLEGARDYYAAEIKDGKIVVSSKDEGEVNGIKAIVIGFTKDKNNSYTISYGYKTERIDAIKIFDQILSTFQFTK